MDQKFKLELEETELEKLFFQLWGYVNRQDLDEDVNADGWGHPKSRIDTEDEKGIPAIYFWEKDKLFKVTLSSPYLDPCLQLTKIYDFRGEVYNYEFFRTNGETPESEFVYGCSHQSIFFDTFLDLDGHLETLVAESNFLSRCKNLAEKDTGLIQIPVSCTLHIRNEHASLNRIVEFFFNRFMVKDMGNPPSNPISGEQPHLLYS